MKIISTKKNEFDVVYTVELDLAAWKKAYAAAKKTVAKNISIPGFRKGHVPAKLVDERVTPEQIAYTAIDRLGKQIHDFVLDSQEFKDSDCIDSVNNMVIAKLDADKSAPTVDVHVDLIPKVQNFSSKDLKNITVPPFDAEVSEDFVQAQIRALLRQDAMISNKDGVIVKGDIAVIDFKGFADGKAFAGGEAKDFELEIGSKSFVDNFEDQLIGHKKGDKFDVNVTFPKNYHKELAGKKAKFEVEVKGVKTIEYPEITKDYLKKFKIEASTKQELENYLRDIFNQQNWMQYQDGCMRIINKAIADKATLNYYPNGLLNMHINQVLKQYEQEGQRYGYKTLNQYKKALQLEDEQFRDVVVAAAKSTLVVALVYEELMEEYKLKVTEEDKKDFLKKLSKYLGDEAKATEQYDKNIDYYESVILREKLLKQMIEYCKKEFKAEKPE